MAADPRLDRLLPLIRRNDPIINSLSINNVTVSDEMVDSLTTAVAGNIFLGRITFISNNLSEKSCKKIFELLLQSPEITHIEICKNSVSDSALIFLSEVLLKMPVSRQPVTLVLRDNSFGYDGISALAQALAKNVPVGWLDLCDNPRIGDKGVAKIANALVTNTTLTGLNILKCNCHEIGVGAFSTALIDNTRLESLLIQDQLKTDAILSLGFLLEDPNCRLKSLHLWKCSINSSMMSILCQSMRMNKSLHILGLSYNSIDDDAAVDLGDMVFRNRCLLKLMLGANKLGSRTAGMLGVAIAKNDKLEFLDLSRNMIGSDGLWALATSLVDNRAVKSLDVRYNGIDATGATILCDLIAKNDTIHALRMSGNRFSDSSVIAIAHELVNNKSLKELELNSVGMNSAGFIALCEALEKNTSLEKIDVASNRICSRALESFEKLLSVNKTLLSVSLSRCGIDDIGVRCIGSGLLTNSTLKTLDLTKNAISVEGLRTLVDSLCGNYSLIHLEIMENPVEGEGSVELSDVLSDYLQRNRYYEHNILMKDLQSLVRDAELCD